MSRPPSLPKDAEPAIPQVVIIAGGSGSRLAGAVPDTAKILAPVHGRAFLSHVLELLSAQGVRRLHLCLGWYSDQVLRFLADRTPDEITVTTSVEQTPMGTAGCLRAAADALDEMFLVLLGDTYTPVDLKDLAERYRCSGSEAAMAVLENQDWLVPSNVAVEGEFVTRYDKRAAPGSMRHVDYGIALLRRASLDRLPAEGSADLGMLFQSLIADRQLAALEVGHRFYEIGSPDSYAEFVRLVGSGELPRRPVPSHPLVSLAASRSGAVGDDQVCERPAPKERLSSRPLFSSPWMTVREDSVRQPDGSQAPFAVVSRADSVLIVCRLPDGRLVMTEQYRYAAGRWSLEFPQGSQESGESLVDAALRELHEETGWIGADAQILADDLYEAGDWATQSFAVVQVRPVRKDSSVLELSELGLRTRLIHPADLRAHLRTGLLCDAATLAALALLVGTVAGPQPADRGGI